MSPAERLAASTGVPLDQCERDLWSLRTSVLRLVAGGVIVRKDRASGVPTDDELVDELAVAYAAKAAHDEMVAERATAMSAVRAKPVALPAPRFGLRRGTFLRDDS